MGEGIGGRTTKNASARGLRGESSSSYPGVKPCSKDRECQCWANFGQSKTSKGPIKTNDSPLVDFWPQMAFDKSKNPRKKK